MNTKEIAAMTEMVANLLAQVDSLSAQLAAVTAERDAAMARVNVMEGALSSVAKEKFYPMGVGVEPEYTRAAKLAQAVLASRPRSPAQDLAWCPDCNKDVHYCGHMGN